MRIFLYLFFLISLSFLLSVQNAEIKEPIPINFDPHEEQKSSNVSFKPHYKSILLVIAIYGARKIIWQNKKFVQKKFTQITRIEKNYGIRLQILSLLYMIYQNFNILDIFSQMINEKYNKKAPPGISKEAFIEYIEKHHKGDNKLKQFNKKIFQELDEKEFFKKSAIVAIFQTNLPIEKKKTHTKAAIENRFIRKSLKNQYNHVISVAGPAHIMDRTTGDSRGQIISSHSYGIDWENNYFSKFLNTDGTINAENKALIEKTIRNIAFASMYGTIEFMKKNNLPKETKIQKWVSGLGCGIYLYSINNEETKKWIKECYANAILEAAKEIRHLGYTNIKVIFNILKTEMNNYLPMSKLFKEKDNKQEYVNCPGYENLFFSQDTVYPAHPDEFIKHQDGSIIEIQNAWNMNRTIGEGGGVEGQYVNGTGNNKEWQNTSFLLNWILHSSSAEDIITHVCTENELKEKKK